MILCDKKESIMLLYVSLSVIHPDILLADDIQQNNMLLGDKGIYMNIYYLKMQ